MPEETRQETETQLTLYRSYTLNIRVRVPGRESAVSDNNYREGDDPFPRDDPEDEVSPKTYSCLVISCSMPELLSQILISGTDTGYAIVKTISHDILLNQVFVFSEVEACVETFETNLEAVSKFAETVDKSTLGMVEQPEEVDQV